MRGRSRYEPGDFVECPAEGCDAPAEVSDVLELQSTSGPIPHAKVVCVGQPRHWYSGPEENL